MQITTAQAAARLGVSTTRVRQFCDAGRLDCVRTLYGRAIDAGSVDSLLSERSGRG